jgi:CHASE3 domain sensor protein
LLEQVLAMTESEGAGRPARGGVVDTTSTPSIRLTGTWGIIAAFVVLTGVLGIDSWTANQSVKASEWVAHTYQVGEHLQQVLSTLQDAETGQRGFLLTGNEAYLEPFTLADGRVQDTVGGLRALTSDNPRQQQSIDRLEPLIVDKLDELKETIALRQADKTGAALAIVRSDRGKLIMDRIRRIVTEMESEEAALLVVRQGDLERATTLSIAGQGVGIVLLIGIAVVVVMKIRNTLTFHRLADEALRESETRYRAIFEQSPVSIWEEDWTAVKVMIYNIARRGAPDWSRYFDSHPE